MQRLVLSTDDVPEAERFSYWREEIGERFLGFSAEPHKTQETPFEAHFFASIGPSIARIGLRCDRHKVVRGRHDIARHGWDDYICLYRKTGICARFDQDRREFVTKPSDLLIADPTMPFSGEAVTNRDTDLWFLPRSLLDPRMPASLRPRSLVLAGQSGLGGMVKGYLDAFAAQIDALDERESSFVADNFCRLLAVACGANAGEHQDALRLARLEEAKRYIDLHLADPEMTPEKAAAALKMSVRQLHLLFEPSATSFAQHVLKRRLEECRAAVTIGGRSVTDIALGFGFNSLWTFNRRFRQAFGVTPSELRRDAAGPRSAG